MIKNKVMVNIFLTCLTLRCCVLHSDCICVSVCAAGLPCFSKNKFQHEDPNIESWRGKFPLFLSCSFPVLSYDVSPLYYQWSSSSPAELIPPGLINQNWHTSGSLARHEHHWTLIKIVCLNLQIPALPLTLWHSPTWQSCEVDVRLNESVHSFPWVGGFWA